MPISFARGIPGPDLLPVDELAACAQAALRDDGRTILSYGSTLGYQPLRDWIGERHGVEPGRVIVTNGSLQAFHLVLATLEPGRVLVERPTYDRPRRILAAEGRPVGELLMHYDTNSQQLVPDANAAFLFVTREGNMGLIETTDRVTRTANLSGVASRPSPGIGFHTGVRFNLKAIIP